MRMLIKNCFIGFLLILMLVLTGCEQKGPAEKAGQKIDQATKKAEQKISQATEKNGRKNNRNKGSARQ